jgi:ribosomal protein S30
MEHRGKYPEHGGLTEFGKVSEFLRQTVWRKEKKKIDHKSRKRFPTKLLRKDEV